MEQTGGRNQRILKGAMGIYKVMQKQNLEAEDIVKHTHKLLTEVDLILIRKSCARFFKYGRMRTAC